VTDPVRVETDGGVLLITLDRPKANAIDVSTSRSLYDAFQHLEEDPSLRVAVVTGAGDRFFSAGWDLKAAAAGESVDADHGPGGFAGLTEFFSRTKPVVAAVNGLALGGGFELALAADMIICADHVELAFPEVRRGVVADAGGVLRLPRRLPEVIARELLLTGRRMSAQEAARWGLVNRVVPGGQLMENALALAQEVCEGAPLAISAVEEILAISTEQPVQDGFRRMRAGDLTNYERMLRSDDAVEGPRAFAEKRAPRWQGR
jgi:crotonobetainyl-CoA hydratase